jgi:hypothetical protein
MLSLCNLRSSDCFTMDRKNGRETETGKTRQSYARKLVTLDQAAA